MKSDAIQVSITFPEKEGALKTRQLLLERRLIASAQLLGPMETAYWWNDTLHEATEFLMLLKTRMACFEAIHTLVTEHHPYDLPEIIATPIQAADDDYFRWIERYTR